MPDAPSDLDRAMTLCNGHRLTAAGAFLGEWARYCPTVQDRWDASVEGQRQRAQRERDAADLAWLKKWVGK
jgi:hypothetical protein